MSAVVARYLDELANPPPDRNVRHCGAGLVHRERQGSGLIGFFTRCGRLWQTGDFEVTDDPVTCKTCIRAAP